MRTLLFVICSLLFSPAGAQSLTLEIANPSAEYREQIVEIPLDDVLQRLGIVVDSLRVRDAAGLDVPFQTTFDGKLLVEAAVRKGGVARFTLSKGGHGQFPMVCHGKLHPERKDDFAWENDRGAYRVYGPALERTKERSYGIDVWTKNTPELVVDDRYYIEDVVTIPRIDSIYRNNWHKRDSLYRIISYHYDHGRGLDPYRVGASLGCGAPALMVGDSIVMPYCFERYEVLDEGPLRFCVRLEQSPRMVCGVRVVENRLITLDKGSNFCKMEVWYVGATSLSKQMSKANPSKTVSLCSGVVLQPEDHESYVLGKNYVSYTDPTDQPNVHQAPLYVAVLFPNGTVTTRKQDNHVLGIVDNYDLKPYTYYFGSAWSKYDVRTEEEWKARIEWYLRGLQSPLQVTLK
jgi:hypothetical protein